MDFQRMVWLLPVALALHEFEEWNILGWYERYFINMPAQRTKTTIRFFLVFLSVTGFVWTGAAVISGSRAVAILILLPLVAMILQNVLQHIYWQFLFRVYAPGIVSGVILLLPLSLYFLYVSMGNDMVPSWYPALFIVLIIPGLVQTVRAKNELTSAIRLVHKFSLFVVNRLGIPNL
jgi:hypothetical protein